MTLQTLLAIAAGGAIGSLCRYGLAVGCGKLFATDFPLGTLTANLLGCLFIGFLWGYFDKVHISHEFRLFIFTGFLGGFTTFSTYARESVQFFSVGEQWHGLAYILISNIFGLSMVSLGFFLYFRFFR